MLNQWKWPDIEGLHDFQGTLMHSADWDSRADLKDKKVTVIGAGSSGIQIVPNLQPVASRIDHYIRGRTWIAPPLIGDEIERRGAHGSTNFQYTEAEIRQWREDPEAYLTYRRRLQEQLHSGFAITLRGEANDKAREFFSQTMAARLAAKPEIFDQILPSFPPGCRRLTPGPGYLEALAAPNVDTIATPIEKVTATAIQTSDGVLREVDVLVCATGFDTTFTGQFPITGRNGTLLTKKWEKRHETYLSIATNDFPNMFISLGPNGGVGEGSILLILERIAEYVAQCAEKMQMQHIRTMAPTKRCVDAFTDYCDQYFEKTVFSDTCPSWYKTLDTTTDPETGKERVKPRVTAIWPGSNLHADQALQKPRWEDFEYTFLDDEEMGWLGDGTCEADHKETGKAYYITSGMLFQDLPAQGRLAAK